MLAFKVGHMHAWQHVQPSCQWTWPTGSYCTRIIVVVHLRVLLCCFFVVHSRLYANFRALERLDIRMSGAAEDEEIAIADVLLNRLRDQVQKK